MRDFGAAYLGFEPGTQGLSRRGDARLREGAALMGICGWEGKGPPGGYRRPFALVNKCQDAFENE